MRINVYVDKSQLNSNKEMTVFLVFRDITGKRAMLHTGMYSPVAFKGREFPSSVPNARQKTSALNKLIVFVEDIALANPELTAPELKDKIGNLIFGRKSKLSLLLTDYIKIYIEEKVYSQGTKGLYISTIRKIEEFDPEATLDTVDLEWLTRFEKHCKNTMSINGMAIPMRNIRSVFNWALKNRKTQNYPFLFYKIKSEETKKRSATVEQLRKLRDYPCRNAQIAEYRDLFFLMFYLLGINAVAISIP